MNLMKPFLSLWHRLRCRISKDQAVLLLAVLVAVCIVGGALLGPALTGSPTSKGKNQTAGLVQSGSQTQESSTKRKVKKSRHLPRQKGESSAATLSTTAIDWTKPTGGPYPQLSKQSAISLEVDLARQRVYIKADGKTIYTMVASTGLDGSTPRGNFTIGGNTDITRGESFYNPSEKMGAKNWVRITGSILFHSIPTDNKGNFITSEAQKLGSPASHGCVRLSVPDSKWIYDNIRTGTPVRIF